MKNFKFSTLFALIATLAFSATMTSCGDDEKTNPETNTGGISSFYSILDQTSLEGWGLVKFGYIPNPMYDENEKFVYYSGYTTVNGGEKTEYDSLSISSSLWGKGKFDINAKTGTMYVPQRNPQTFEAMGDPQPYDATIEGSLKDLKFIITIPGLMQGGTTITAHLGTTKAPAVAVSKTYDVRSYVDNANNNFPPKSYRSTDETMVVAVNPDYETVNIQFTSKSTPSWGTYVFSNVSVERKSNAYYLSGEGTTVITNNHNGSVRNYAAEIDATVKDGNITGEINIPGVMGGITIHLNPDDFDDVINN